ncbi:MAG: NAD(P)/FAD-dependent oxidoreductase [Lentisphaeria bacterium]|nr:NAD(P)/FAD-dependent oxidoreductase [Lentisphaeria bacterium]
MDIVIAGGGVSAFEAALAARKNAPDARVAVYSEESLPPYRRPALPGLICAEKAEAEKIFIRPESFYRDNGIELHLSCPLEALDLPSGTAMFGGAGAVKYDRLVLAVGGRAFVPPLPGARGENVVTLRNFADLLDIRARLAAGAREATLVGAGILGLEAADALLACGVRVTLLEHADRLLSRNISPEDSLFMTRTLAEMPGLRLICNADTREVTPEGVVLADGTRIRSDFVLFSTGSRPALEKIPPEIARERAVTVDAFMRTSVPGVFACGDCAQFEGKVCGLYTTSRAMAAVAGANAAGASVAYVPKNDAIMLNTLGFKKASDGKVTKK